MRKDGSPIYYSMYYWGVLAAAVLWDGSGGSYLPPRFALNLVTPDLLVGTINSLESRDGVLFETFSFWEWLQTPHR